MENNKLSVNKKARLEDTFYKVSFISDKMKPRKKVYSLLIKLPMNYAFLCFCEFQSLTMVENRTALQGHYTL